MDELLKLNKIYSLKNVERANTIDKRKESSAEHSWSSIILADYFITKYNLKLDRLKVYDLLLYHDVIEVESGDIPIHHEEKRKNKKEKERKALIKLKKEIPLPLKNKYLELFNEFEEGISTEAKFCIAIDKMDVLITALNNKKDWKGWTEEMVRKFHGKAISKIPEINTYFEKILEYTKENNYFNQ